MKKVLIMIYLSVLISSCNGEEKKENKKETKKEVQIEKVEKKSETKKEDNNSKVTYIKIKPIDENGNNEDESHSEYTKEEYIDYKYYDKYYDEKLKFISKIDKKIEDIKDGVCYMVVDGEKSICGRIKNGKREGKWKFWNSEGEKIADMGYKDGKLDGICRVGNLSLYIVNYKNGKKDGRYNYFGEDCSEEEGLYEDGERIGEWSGYNNGGGFPERTIYINGEIVEYDILSEEGNEKVRIEKYRNNRLEQIDENYQYDKSKVVCTNGELIEKIEYDENGNIKKKED